VVKPSLISFGSGQLGTTITGLTRRSHPFLVHKPLIRAVIDDALAKHGRRQLAVDLLGVQVGMLAVQDEVVPLWAQKHGRRLSQHDKGEAVSMLFSAISEELVRVDAVLNRAPDPREDVEHDRGALTIGEEELLYDIVDSGNEADETKRQRDGNGCWELQRRLEDGRHREDDGMKCRMRPSRCRPLPRLAKSEVYRWLKTRNS